MNERAHDDADRRPWIVFAADVALAPATHGSRVRNVQLVDALRKAGFRVLYLYWERTPREGHVTAMRSLVDELDVVRAQRGAFGKRSLRMRRGMARWFTGQPRAVTERTPPLSESAWWWLVEDRDEDAMCPPALRARLEEIFASRPVAALIVSYANLAPLCRIARTHRVMSMVDTLDVMHLRAETLREQRIRPSGLLVPRQTEQKWLAEADFVIAIQEREARALADMVGAEKTLLVEHAVSVPPGFDPDPAREKRVVLLGSNNRPNQHGLSWFLEAVWPRVLQSVPDAELCVFGPLSATSACSGPNVRAMGSPERTDGAYRMARVVINPVRAGAGLKIKTVEALAHSRALVTTSAGADGLTEAAGDAFHMTDDAAEFADACSLYLRDFEAARAIGRRGGELARTRFDPERVYAPLITKIRAK